MRIRSIHKYTSSIRKRQRKYETYGDKSELHWAQKQLPGLHHLWTLTTPEGPALIETYKENTGAERAKCPVAIKAHRKRSKTTKGICIATLQTRRNTPRQQGMSGRILRTEIHRKKRYKKRKSPAALQTDERRSTNTPAIAKVLRKNSKPWPRYKPTGRVTSNDDTMLRTLSTVTGRRRDYHGGMLQLPYRPTKCPAMTVCGCSS
jgi:hypothetical protein